MLALFKNILNILSLLGVLSKWLDSYLIKREAQKKAKFEQALKKAEKVIDDEKKLRKVRSKHVSVDDVVDELRDGKF